jgi:hypothetical protein
MKVRSVVTVLAGIVLCSVTPVAKLGAGAQQAGAVQQGQQQTTPPPQSGVQPPAGQRQGGGGRGRGGVQVMSLTTTAWQDGSAVPLKHTQAGEEVSPPLAWTNPPETTQSFVLIVHDIDATNADATSDTLHWMVWNIPASSRALPERVPHGPNLADGSRQISVTGPYYRGPAAPATGPSITTCSTCMRSMRWWTCPRSVSPWRRRARRCWQPWPDTYEGKAPSSADSGTDD